MTFEEAFLRQAQSDFAVFEMLRHACERGEVEQSHVLHYLQMATEKLAKASIVRWTGYTVRGAPDWRHHEAFSLFIGSLTLGLDGERLLAAIGYSLPGAVQGFLTSSEPVWRAIEDLCPARADAICGRDQTPNAEYPWSPTHTHPNVPSGSDWTAPADCPFPVYATVMDVWGDGPALLGLLARLMNHFDQIP